MSDISFLDSVLLEIAQRYPGELSVVNDEKYIELIDTKFDFKLGKIDFERYEYHIADSKFPSQKERIRFSEFIKYAINNRNLAEIIFVCVLHADASLGVSGKLKNFIVISDELSDLPAHIYITDEAARFLFVCSWLGGIWCIVRGNAVW